MSIVSTWFQKEVWRWRSGAAVVWSTVLSRPVIFLFLLLSDFEPLHPGKWLAGSVWGLLSPSTWPCHILLALMLVAVAATDAKHFTPVLALARSRWAVVWGVLRPVRMLHAAGHGMAGAVITACLCAVTGGRMYGFTRPCQQQGSVCLNEQHVFVVLHGAMVGALYSIAFFLHGHTLLTFPPIQQPKFIRVKREFVQQFGRSAGVVLRIMPCFCLLYLLTGYFVQWFITSNIAVAVDTTEESVSSVWGMLDVGLLWHTALTGWAVHLMFSTTAILHSVYHTQALTFPIEAQFEGERGRCLQDALTEQQNTLVQHLAYQDLYLLSRYSQSRRQQLFSLSQLGGHPHYWSAVCEACVALLARFAAAVAAANRAILASAAAGTGPPLRLMGDSNHNTTLGGGPSNRSTGTDASGLSASHLQDMTATSAAAAPAATKAPGRVLFPWLMSPLPDMASRGLFVNAQVVVWAIQGLSHLVTASYTEDRYGVVQKSLAEILAALLNTYEAVEKHMKLASVSRKPHKNGGSSDDDVALRFATKAALKTSIYRIITTFSSHLNAIPLNTEHRRRLTQFHEYRE